jgi:hypothetical protein
VNTLTLKAQKKAAREASKKRADDELIERARSVSGLKAEASEARALEAYITRLRAARLDLQKRFSDLPQLSQMTSLLDYELERAARRLASAVIDGTRGF